MKKIKEYIRWKLYKSLHKPGHYYSTIPALEEVKQNRTRIFNKEPPAAVNLQTSNQKALLQKLKEYATAFSWPAEKTDSYRYYYNNVYFNQADAFVLYAMIRLLQPKRIIEIGSGFSSAVMMDTNERFMNNSVAITFIEPYPDRLKSLMYKTDSETKQYKIQEEKIQTVPLSLLEELHENDILFVDSSHVSKVGSDVNHILFHILPKLNKGVIVHFHDITYPFEYPQEWIMQGIYWNEAYLLRAFLMYNTSFEVLLQNHYWQTSEDKDLKYLTAGGASLWLKKTNV